VDECTSVSPCPELVFGKVIGKVADVEPGKRRKLLWNLDVEAQAEIESKVQAEMKQN
jgi:hypothetical protein